jgi:dTDP-4-amino-4,6-dideoxygalactose transaminase
MMALSAAKNSPGLGITGELLGSSHAWHIYALRLKIDQLSIGRNQFIEQLRARKIGASVHFVPAHLHGFYRKKYGYKSFPIAYREYQRLVSLHLFPGMHDQDV